MFRYNRCFILRNPHPSNPKVGGGSPLQKKNEIIRRQLEQAGPSTVDMMHYKCLFRTVNTRYVIQLLKQYNGLTPCSTVILKNKTTPSAIQ